MVCVGRSIAFFCTFLSIKTSRCAPGGCCCADRCLLRSFPRFACTSTPHKPPRYVLRLYARFSSFFIVFFSLPPFSSLVLLARKQIRTSTTTQTHIRCIAELSLSPDALQRLKRVHHTVVANMLWKDLDGTKARLRRKGAEGGLEPGSPYAPRCAHIALVMHSLLVRYSFIAHRN